MPITCVLECVTAGFIAGSMPIKCHISLNSWMAFVVAVLQQHNLHFISNKKLFFSYSKLQSLVSILVHKVFGTISKIYSFSLGSNS
jgi:hypothetical protein